MLKHVWAHLLKPGGRVAIPRQARDDLRAANTARDSKDWVQAAQLYRRVLSHIPGDAAIWTQYGHALKESGLKTEAEAAYRTGLAFAPQDAELFLQLGHLLKIEGRFAEAEAAYLRSNALDPTLGAKAEIAWRSDTLNQPRPEPPPAENETLATVQPHVPAHTLHQVADEARDRGDHRQAADTYRAYLAQSPNDGGVWVQYGHVLRELGEMAPAEAAYRTAIELKSDDADAHFQLGNLLCWQGRTSEGFECFRRSLGITALGYAIRPMIEQGFPLRYDDIQPTQAADPRLFVEVTDLMAVLRHSPTISGIQRVQVNLIRHLADHDSSCIPVFWQGGLLWSLAIDRLRDTALSFDPTVGLHERRELVEKMLTEAVPVRPGSADTFLVTGAFWIGADPAYHHAWLKRDGTRLGALIYDFIPLTSPEFLPQIAINEFCPGMAELVFQLDFALTISDHVGKEFRRLRAEAGLPQIPVETIPLAHEPPASGHDGPDEWPAAISALRGREYVLCVGTIAAHKNHIVLLHAWRLLLQMGIEPPALVFAGRFSNNIQDLKDQLRTSRNLDGRVVVVEGLDDATLRTLYRNCLFTVLPSFVEGWGLPVGESLAYGKLCLASNTTSIPEVGGEFTVPIDPFNARGIAEQVAELCRDRATLARKEQRIRSDFHPRGWNEVTTSFLAALGRAATTPVRDLVRLPPARLLHLRTPDPRWPAGTSLPPTSWINLRVLARSSLIHGWHPSETWGCWMNGPAAAIRLVTDQPSETPLRIVLLCQTVAWPRKNWLQISAGTGQTRRIEVPGPRRDFIATLDCTAGPGGVVNLDLEVGGGLPSVSGEHRRLGIGIRRLLYLQRDQSAAQPAGTLLRPAALTGRSGQPIVPIGRDALVEVARREAVLAEGWHLMEAWGTWMRARTATIVLRTNAPATTLAKVTLRLRVAAKDGGTLTTTTVGDGGATTVVLQPNVDTEQGISITGKVDSHGCLTITLRIAPASARVGLVALWWNKLGDTADRLSALESLLLGPVEDSVNDAELLARDAHYVVAGHLAGSYSLAAVNRRMVLALDTAAPGSTTAFQLEGDHRPEMEGLPEPDATRIRPLAYDGAQGDGPTVMICGHWPVRPPPMPSDLPLSYFFWEESVIPREIIRTLNEHYRGVLSPARSVTKALIDSGLRLPVREVGYAPDLTPYLPLAEARSATQAPHAGKFTFLHVSSCFPRKGVDVLLAAYAKAFTRAAPVRLVIKGFPNEHNDVVQQVTRLRATATDIAEIQIIDADLPQSALLDLYRQADCVVLPTRGEGFNIPAAEAMATGLPLIVTGIGGHMDFVAGSKARLIDYRFTQSRSHVSSPGSVWAEPDADDLCKALQEAVQASDEGVASASAALARRVGDSAAWGSRVRGAIAGLLAKGPAKRPHIAWVSTWSVRCGIAEYSRLLLDGLKTASNDVTILCDYRTAADAIAASPIPARATWSVDEPETMVGLAAAIERTAADIVVVQHHPGLMSWMFLSLLLDDERVLSRPIVITLHNTRDLLDDAPDVRARVIDSLSRCSRVLVHGVADLNLLKSFGLVDNVTLISQGVPATSTSPRPPREMTAASEVIIGTYGFFLPHKGFDQLIEALPAIRHAYPKARIRLVTAEYPVKTSTDFIAKCRALAERLGVADAIEWHTDYLENEESIELMQGCDVLVLPYQHTKEASSAAVRTALAAQVPVLVTPISIFEELGDSVLRLQDIDAERIANGTLWLLGERSMREHLVQSAQRWSQENSWTNTGERLRGMLEGLVAFDED